LVDFEVLLIALFIYLFLPFLNCALETISPRRNTKSFLILSSKNARVCAYIQGRKGNHQAHRSY